jgi:hypothetical protein
MQFTSVNDNSSNCKQKFEYTAIIVEPRKHKALEFVLTNACDCLPDEWKIILFHGNENIDYVSKIVEAINLRFNNRIFLVNLNVGNLNQTSYSKILTNKNTIYDHINTDMFLVFQTDSIIIKNNAYLINEYLTYDYVGSPWLMCNYEPTKRCNFIGNGGFSLRNKSKMLEIIEKIPYNNEFEDLYFSTNYDNVLVNKPSYEKAMQFCVGEVFCEYSLAYHRFWPYDYNNFETHQNHYYHGLKQKYPECKMLMDLQFEENE